MNIHNTVKIFSSLMQGSFSRLELAKRSGACPKTVGRVLQEMKAQGLIYVIAYANATDGRNRVKLYTIGNGEDAEPKSSQSQEDRSRKSYLNKLAAQKQTQVKTTFVGGKGLWQ
jgi:hypothetical protein